MNVSPEFGYFEDFAPGMKLAHSRGSTITDIEGQFLTKLVMNTADSHWNEAKMANTPFNKRIVFGFITASVVIGLATQDTSAHAIREIGLDKIRFSHPVFHGDTLYAFTEVVRAELSAEELSGFVTFKHTGLNQEDIVVFEGERTVLIRMRDVA